MLYTFRVQCYANAINRETAGKHVWNKLYTCFGKKKQLFLFFISLSMYIPAAKNRFVHQARTSLGRVRRYCERSPKHPSTPFKRCHSPHQHGSLHFRVGLKREEVVGVKAENIWQNRSGKILNEWECEVVRVTRKTSEQHWEYRSTIVNGRWVGNFYADLCSIPDFGYQHYNQT